MILKFSVFHAYYQIEKFFVLRITRTCLLFLFFFIAGITQAQSSGLLGIDHRLNLDESGIWARNNQLAVQYTSALTVMGLALYEGKDSRLGKTAWQSIDAFVWADTSAAIGKEIFRRQRPRDGNDPNAFFKLRKDQSFPSDEMTHISAVVTPFILEYRNDTPAVWLLATLPAYVGVARMKS